MKKSNWKRNPAQEFLESFKNQPETPKEKKERLEKSYGPLPDEYFKLSSSEQAEYIVNNILMKKARDIIDDNGNQIRPHSSYEKSSKDKLYNESRSKLEDNAGRQLIIAFILGMFFLLILSLYFFHFTGLTIHTT